MRNFVRAATFTATLTWRHLCAEPARLPLLVLRVTPGWFRRGVRRTAIHLGPWARAYALWDAGHREQALDTVRGAAKGASPRHLARLFAFALAVEEPQLAAELLARLPNGPRRTEAEHRLALVTGRAVPVETTGQSHPIKVTPNRRTQRDDAMNDRKSNPRVSRVLHLVTNALPHTNAGYTQRTHRIALGQRSVGLEPHVVTRPGYPLTKGVFDPRSRVEVDGVSYHRLVPWVAPADSERETTSGFRCAAPLVERLQPDVLHAASNHRNAELALRLGAHFGVPVVYEVRGFLEESWLSRDSSRSTEDAFYRCERARETERMRAADLVVTLGETMRADIVARGVAEDNVIVVPNAVDEKFLTPLPSGAELRAELGIPPDDFVVGTTTSCYSYEGLDLLVDAVAALRHRGVPAHALIVGDGPELTALRARAAGSGLAGAAHFPGRVPASEIRSHHAIIDVFAVPRRDERVSRLVTPLKPVEAMAGGLPVVASDVRALREIVEPGVTGELIPPDDSEILADQLEKLFYSQDARTTYGLAGHEKVGYSRTWNAAALRYMEAYASLSHGAAGPGHQ